MYLACRLYETNALHSNKIQIKSFDTWQEQPLPYDHYDTGVNKIELSIIIKNKKRNEYGFSADLFVDKIARLEDRDRKSNPYIRYNIQYTIQIFETEDHYKDHMVVFGPKQVDPRLIKAITYRLQKENPRLPLVVRLIVVDFTHKNLETISNAFPNIQHFCVNDIPDNRTKDVIIKGNNLEETDLFDRFVMDRTTKGPTNILGLTMHGKIFYISKDGSMYSRKSFARVNILEIVYQIYVKFKKLKVIKTTLADF